MNKTAAFFDLDGTIFRMITTYEILKEALHLNYIKKEIWEKELQPLLNIWENREGQMNEFISQYWKVYREFVANYPDLNNQLTELVLKKQINRLNVYTKLKLKEFKEKNIDCFIISDANQNIVDFVVKELDLKGWYGSCSYLDSSGEIVVKRLKKEQKADKLKEICKDFWYNPEQCYAFWDTHIDFEMLESVWYPTIINPIKELIELVKWSQKVNSYNLVIEKKWVVYKISWINIKETDFYFI